MKKTMKTHDSQKFLTNHPGQHKIFIDLLKSTKQTKSKFPWQTEETQINTELFNMIRNQDLLKVRREDTVTKQHRKNEKPQKRVTWSKNLFEVHTITYREYQETRLTQAIWPGDKCLRNWTTNSSRKHKQRGYWNSLVSSVLGCVEKLICKIVKMDSQKKL